jgi:hypothetical protein
MTDDRSRIIWRVRADNGDEYSSAFDALVLPTDVRGAERTARHLALPVPYEGELPTAPLTLIVRARPGAGPLTVECDILRSDGSRRAYGRSLQPLAVIVCSSTGIIVAGLPAPDEEPSAMPA